jgi:hypothetical protein
MIAFIRHKLRKGSLELFLRRHASPSSPKKPDHRFFSTERGSL